MAVAFEEASGHMGIVAPVFTTPLWKYSSWFGSSKFSPVDMVQVGMGEAVDDAFSSGSVTLGLEKHGGHSVSKLWFSLEGCFIYNITKLHPRNLFFVMGEPTVS